MKYYIKIIMLTIQNYIRFSYILNIGCLSPWLFSYPEAQVASAIIIMLSPITMPVYIYAQYKYKINK